MSMFWCPPSATQPRAHRRDAREGRGRVLVIDRHQQRGAGIGRGLHRLQRGGAIAGSRAEQTAHRAPGEPEDAERTQDQAEAIEQLPAIGPREKHEQPGGERRRQRTHAEGEPPQREGHDTLVLWAWALGKLSPAQADEGEQAKHPAPVERALQHLARHHHRRIGQTALTQMFDGKTVVVLHADRH